jgi:hypothetical protein
MAKLKKTTTVPRCRAEVKDVIPGRAEGASPESRASGFPAFLDSGLAASRRPGMTAKVFQQPAKGTDAFWRNEPKASGSSFWQNEPEVYRLFGRSNRLL